MKRLIALSLVFLLLAINSIHLLSINTGSTELNHIVDDGKIVTENTLVIPNGGGIDLYLGNISIRKGVPVSDAYFNLTASSNGNGEYPYDLKLDVGNDKDNQYEYIGVGWGNMGQQTVFDTNTTAETYTYTSSGSHDTIKLMLPKTADVTSAQLDVTGEFFQLTDKNNIDNNQNSVQEVHPADLDDDGDTDVVAVGNNEVVFYNNTDGMGSSWLEHKINGSQSNAATLFVFDIDNDTDMDVVAGSRSGTWGDGPIIYYRNLDGKGRSWGIHTVDSIINTCYNLEAADMDNDGDGDIVAVSYNWSASATGVFWYNNTDGNGTNWTEHEIVTNYNRVRALTIFDVDDDGDNDTVVCRGWPRNIDWFENQDGKATTWSNSNNIASLSVSLFNLDNGDIDNDGDTDIAVACSDGIRWYSQPANPMSTWTGYRAMRFNTAWWGTDVAITDIGNPADPPDGNLDLVAATTGDDAVFWVKNDGNPAKNSWERHTIGSPHAEAYTVKVAEIDNSGYVDIVVGANTASTVDDVVWYNMKGSYPTNVEMDIGADTSNEWTFNTGYFDTTETVDNLESTFDTLIGTNPITDSDKWGNELVTIVIKVSSNTGGRVVLHNVDIQYDYTVKVVGSSEASDKSLAEEIHEFISPSGTGNDTIPIVATSSTGGQLKIHNITIIYNDYPKVKVISGYGLDEDTKDDKLIDLSQYFTDDYMDSADLTYTVVKPTDSPLVTVKITEGKYLSVDAESGANNNDWFGEVEVIVSAEDDAELVTESAPFNVTVYPVNDEPIVGSKSIPNIIINEGGENLGLDLDSDQYFIDVDSTDLYYDFAIDPLEENDNEKVNASIDNGTNVLTVEAYGDYFTTVGNSLRMRIYCDDDQDDINQSTAYQDIFITVNNQDDDAPSWLPIPDVIMNEDEPKEDAFNIFDYVSDIDNKDDDLKFSIMYISNNKIQVKVDNQNNIDITSDENYFGSATVDIRASDGTNVGVTTFNVIVQNVNDKPEVELLSPRNEALIFSDTIELKWKGSDVDPGDTLNLTYSIFLDTTSGTTPHTTGHSETSLVVSGLTDKSTYYWKVIPYDGTEEGVCITIPCPSEFTIDIGQKPYTCLKLPGNEAVTNVNYTVLIWDGFGEEGFMINYDVYLLNKSFEFPFPASALIASGMKETELLVENLEASETYYWTVIPRTAKGTGTCESGIWTFMYDPSANPYNFEIEAPEILKIPVGDIYSSAIRFKNTGANPDILVPSIDADQLKFTVTLEGADSEHLVEDGETLLLFLNISADRIPEGIYDVTISAESIGGQDTKSVTITIEIYEKKEEVQGFMTQSNIFSIALIIIIIIIIAMVLFLRKKRIDEEKKRVEAELLKPLPSKTLEAADVQYIQGAAGPTPVGGTPTAPAQLPQVTLPSDAAAYPQYGAPAAAYPGAAQTQQLPQLPPAAEPGAAAYPETGVTAPYGVQPQAPVQPQPQVYPEQPAATPTHVYPPQQPATDQGVTGTPPVQVPYEPKPKQQPMGPPDFDFKPPSQAETAEPKVPTVTTPQTQAVAPPSQDIEQLNELLKTKYIQGNVTEETYISLKKELKDKILSGATIESMDDVIKQFINGEISESEYRVMRMG